MSKNKTRVEKIKVENRILKKENEDLKATVNKLQEHIKSLETNKRNKKTGTNKKRKWLGCIYDITVSALILIFVYWIALIGLKEFSVPSVCMCILFILISLKNAFSNTELKFRKMMKGIFDDLIKPFFSMLLGLVVCLICMGEKWRSALDYALDVGNMFILVIFVVPMVLVICLFSKMFFFIFNKVKNKIANRIIE